MKLIERVRMIWLAVRGPKFAVGDDYIVGGRLHEIAEISVSTNRRGNVTYTYVAKSTDTSLGMRTAHYESSMESA